MKIDLAEVNRAKVSISSSKSTLQGQINDAKSSMKSIVSSGALSGKVKGAIDAKISNHQIPLLTSYYDTISSLDREFEKLINNFKSTVKETNDHALIDSNELTQLEAKFSPKLTEFTQIETQFKNAYADISGIVAIKKANGSGFKEEMEKTKKVLTNTKTWMSSFKGSSSSIAENIARQTAQLGKLSSTSGVSYTSPEALTIFQDKAFKKHVSKEHKKAKELEKEELRARKQSTKNKGLAYAATVGGVNKTEVNRVGEQISEGIGYGYTLGDAVLDGVKISGEKMRIQALGMGSRNISPNDLSRIGRRARAMEAVGDDLIDVANKIGGHKVWKGLGVAGTVVGVAFDYNDQMSKHNDVKRAVKNTTAHTAIQSGAAAVGMAIGTAIPIPVVGTLIGAGAGMVLGNLGSDIYDWVETGAAQKSITKKVKNASKAINNIKKDISKLFSNVGKSLGGALC